MKTQFSIRRLLVVTTLVAVGVAAISSALRFEPESTSPFMVIIVQLLWLGGAMMLGAGLLTPFKHPLWGALIGLLVQACFGPLIVQMI